MHTACPCLPLRGATHPNSLHVPEETGPVRGQAGSSYLAGNPLGTGLSGLDGRACFTITGAHSASTAPSGAGPLRPWQQARQRAGAGARTAPALPSAPGDTPRTTPNSPPALWLYCCLDVSDFPSFTLSAMSLWRTTRGKHVIGQNQGTSCPPGLCHPVSSQASEALGAR